MIISKKLIIFFIVIVMALCSFSIVYAASDTYSTFKSFSVVFSGSTRSYQNQAIQKYYPATKSLEPRTFILNNNSISHPAGYYGLIFSMTDDKGNTIYTSTTWYTSSSCVGIEAGPSSYSQKAKGNYRSVGVTYVYTGNGYSQTTTNYTPYTTL